ncbi:hypothetical protein ACFSQT_31285 [Mesorhizobium calcicola]|uniref:Uncharacterized protein n=1 Tax=Mesorhizobium calcicola TaxID=1300310 RepID=A0ABW4WPM8_9HYPH
MGYDTTRVVGSGRKAGGAVKVGNAGQQADAALSISQAKDITTSCCFPAAAVAVGIPVALQLY